MKLSYKLLLVACSALLFAAVSYAQNYSDADSVVVKPFGIVQKASQVPGLTRTVLQSDLEHAVVGDFRTRLIGALPGLEVTQVGGEADRTETGSAILSNNWTESLVTRGSRNVVCIVDDVVIPFEQLLLEPSQIESVTLLTEAADKALFGPVASGGALYITTKRGGYNRPASISVDVESGVSLPGVWPEWVGGEDYARMNNTARAASNYEQLYSADAIAGYGLRDAWNTTTPNVDYKSLMYKDFKNVTRFGVNAQGGSETTKYNISLAGLTDNGILKLGDPNFYDRINLNMSFSTKIGQYLEASVGAVGMLSFYQAPSQGEFAYYRYIPAVAFPVDLGSQTESGETFMTYAVSKAFSFNPYATMVEGGSYLSKKRTGMINLTLNTDLSFLIPGLKSKTFANMNSFFLQDLGKKNDYFAYYWAPGVEISELERSPHVNSRQSDKSVLGSSTHQGWTAYERLYYDYAKDGHTLNASLTYYMDNSEKSGDKYFIRTQNLIGTLSYNWQGKYFADLILDYAGSTRFAKGYRFALLPTLSLGWRPSEKIKFNAQAGLLGDYDVYGSHYLYQGLYSKPGTVTFGQATSNPWFGGTTQKEYYYTTIKRLANPELTWAKSLDLELGIEAKPAEGLTVGAEAYWIKRFGIITETNAEFPDVTGYAATSFYDNYNATDAYGVDLQARYRRTFGDFRFGLGGWAGLFVSYDTQLANDVYSYDWERQTGRRSDTYRGFVCLGKFNSADEIASSATYGAETQVGDLKYKDLNTDGKIDASDMQVIGYTSPLLRYTLDLQLGWKGFDLYITGAGRAFYQLPMTSDYFWGGYGDNNYSVFMRDNIGGDYPRLSYLQATDNFVESDFWLRDGGYFKIKNVELAHTWTCAPGAAVKSIRLSLRGSNLCTFTKVKYVDPESILSGVTTLPIFRTVTMGLKFNF